jgi:hypothetical protein
MDLPEPLTPAGCDLRDFAFMPLDVQRLRDSDLAALESPECCWSAVLLWCASWHQVPAASLPDDDRVLAQLAGFGRVVKEWQRVREGALRGWIKCTDGRLYHPVVSDKACDAWESKFQQRWKSECARIKKHNQRHGTKVKFPTLDEFLSPDYRDHVPRDISPASPGTTNGSPSVVPRETPSKGDGDRDRDIKEEGDRTAVAANPPSARPGELSAAMRRHSIEAQPGDPRIIAAAAAGVSVETVEAACAEAKSSDPTGRIKAGFVLAIAERWTADAAKPRSSPTSRASTQSRSYHDERAETIAGLTGRSRSNESDERTIDVIATPIARLAG